MAEKKVYFNSGFLNKVKDKKSDKAPDYRINITLDTDTLDAIIAAGGKLQLAGWEREGANGKYVSFVASADTFLPQSKPSELTSDYPDEMIPF